MLRGTDRPLTGILLMLGFCVLAPVGDAFAKVLGTRMGLGQLIAVRFAVQALMLVPVAMAVGLTLRPGRRITWLVALRTVLHVAASWMMVAALRHLPLADAIAIVFVMPFMVLILGHALLGEVVGPRRLAACAFGFAGTLMVIQPSFVAVGWAALLPVGVALSFTLFMLVTRHIAQEIDPIAMQAISAVMASAVLVPALVAGHAAGLPELRLTGVEPHDAVLMVLMGVTTTVGLLLMTWSLRFAPAATLAPMQYLEIPIATLIGWLVFHALPNGLAAAGIVVTMAAGLYMIHRERLAAR